MNKKVILSHSGKQHSYQVGLALDNLGYLDKFYTSSYVTPLWLQRLIVNRNNQYWSRRFLQGLYGEKVEANWRFELKEILYSKFYGQSEKTLSAVFERDVLFDKYLASKIPYLKAQIFWGFQGSCYESLLAAKNSGKLTICEMAAAHAPAAVRILGEEKKLHPEWADSLDFFSFPEPYYSRLVEEPHAADIVIGASGFTLQTLKAEGVDERKLRYLPLGFELDRIPFSEKIHSDGPLRLLYAGRITQRKGIKYLLDAMRQFDKKDVVLDIIGNVHGNGEAFNSYKDYFNWHPAISQYDLLKKYNEYDAFILPSIFEGFGLVIVEAMAAGLPVITTPNSIGPELVRDDINGYLIPIRDTVAIVSAIEKLLSKSPEELKAMRWAARTSALDFSWNAYSIRLESFMKHGLSEEFYNQ